MTARTEQNRRAQQTRREKMKAQGLKPVTVWIPMDRPDMENVIRDYVKHGFFPQHLKKTPIS